jgi:hypothetical protein
MTPASDLPRRPAQLGRVLFGTLPYLVLRMRQRSVSDPLGFALLVLLVAGVTLAGITVSTSFFPPSFLAVPLLFGGLLLTTRPMRALAAVVVLAVVVDVIELGWDEVRAGALTMLTITGLVAYEYSRSRDETGLGGLSGDAVLVELRNRLEQQGQIPALPAGWEAEVVVEPAGGVPFAGDFVVSARVDKHRFETALVDVSGKGVEAGTRSLLLSGAMGGLLGSNDPKEFLSSANAYLVRQEWDEGFATAVHVVLDLDTGAVEIGSAGHLPVAHFDAGSGRWTLLNAAGPALGLLRQARYESKSGRIRPGDALLLYTDGLVEVPGRDLDRGIDKLLGEAEQLVPRGFRGGGRVLLDRVTEHGLDDRGLVLIWRAAG